MDTISAWTGMLIGYFAFSIGAFVIEYIINKSNNNKWGYKITKTVIALNIALLVYIFAFSGRRGH